ncbi:MAG: AbiH family protein [bacterium]|nr:AbiH family protein [bacterium]
MDILVIGNGFDLAHKLKTSFKDFLEFCEQKYYKKIPNWINYGTSFIDNIWLRHFITRRQELGNNWIDLEEEIFNVIKAVTRIIGKLPYGEDTIEFPVRFSIEKDITYFSFYKLKDYLVTTNNINLNNNKQYEKMETNDFSRLYTYIQSYDGLINFLYDKLREFTKGFEDYLKNDVLAKMPNNSKFQLSLQSIGVQPKSQDVFVLSFNYTNTCEILYKQKFNTYCNLRIKPIYVHGRVCDSGNCNLILGTQSFANNDIPVNFNVFKKHNQRHRYGTIEAYQDFLMKLLTNPRMNARPIFHVIGHSLDKTDHNILKHVFLANKNAIINIYYHDEEAQERLINNITEIIGEEEVMAKVRLIYQHDKERGILRYKDETIVI